MERIRTFDNLRKICLKSFEWRHRDLSSNVEPTVFFSIITKFNLYVTLIAIIISLFVIKISDDLVNAILTFTSIFATLIIPVLILVYDKFAKDPNSHLTDIERKSQGALERLRLFKAFTNRYIFVTLENIILSVLIIVLILIYKTFLTDFFSYNVFDYKFDIEWKVESMKIFWHILLEMILKIIFLTLLLKFIYFLFFSIGAIGDFFISVLNEDNNSC
ncbi:hypothetical protein OGH69_09000 [Flavobacterium sp. MFBS3-15]|uniref:hypothetical protein n=1 Tax=Flavobacterium sp. MFBS3-15 TaxID=2989816 RepID=UPI00223557F8|nr:hypothetical protein [Flavobacterium sp. MFBS3-15]MCW4469099.1 hypothetical protein [Flavobacterium sp. MFBS3-15]